eukprot:299201-Amphidinium_carterae.1
MESKRVHKVRWKGCKMCDYGARRSSIELRGKPLLASFPLPVKSFSAHQEPEWRTPKEFNDYASM